LATSLSKGEVMVDVKRERKYLARGAVERPLADGLGVGVEQAGGQWARARGGLAGATMSPVAQGNIGAADRRAED
jgi:hypothetical protein